jgi:hypothetical protein
LIEDAPADQHHSCCQRCDGDAADRIQPGNAAKLTDQRLPQVIGYRARTVHKLRKLPDPGVLLVDDGS